MDTKIKMTCPNCSQMYNIRPPSQQKINFPLLLACGHSMCKNCVSNIIKFMEPIECKICHQQMAIKSEDVALLMQNKISIYDLFPVNRYMTGELLEISEKYISDQVHEKGDCYIDLQAILRDTDHSQAACTECKNVTNKMCQQCQANLCENCFNKSHRNFVFFKNHFLKDIEPAFGPNKCELHQNKPLDYFCKDCKKSICMDCLMVGGEKSCRSHYTVAIEDVNKDYMKDISEKCPKVDEIFKRLTKTAVEVGNLLHNMENQTGASSDLTQVTTTIEQHFSKLFTAIQKHKEEVESVVTKLKCGEKESLVEIKKELAVAIKNARDVWNKVGSLKDAKNVKMNLVLLLDEINKVAETPWYLTKNESNSEHFKVTVNEELCEQASGYIKLEGDASSTYKLLPTSELVDTEIPTPPSVPVYPPQLPKDVREKYKPKTSQQLQQQQQAPPPAFFKDVPKYHKKNSSNSSLNSSASESSNKNCMARYSRYYDNAPSSNHQKPAQQVTPCSESEFKPLKEGDQELVFITHIVDPHNFYVQRQCHQPIIKELVREFRTNSRDWPKPSINQVTEGKLYMVYNEVDHMWQRGRVINIEREDPNKPKFYLFCIDFGSTEIVTIDKLRLLLPARVQSPPPLAICCKLANCVSKGRTWTKEDALLIQSIVDNKRAVIYIREICTSNHILQLYCDVTTYEDGTSLAHALVFHERARLLNPRMPYPKIPCLVEMPKLFKENSDFHPMSVEFVYICHIVSPDHFYVRKRHVQGIFEKLCDDLEKEYKHTKTSGTIYLPKTGMVCVANLRKYGSQTDGFDRYARAVVTELPGRERVRVELPDIGCTVLLPWTELRAIHHKFTTLSALATKCHLAGITPINKKWSIGAVALMKKFEGELLELRVDSDEHRHGDSVGVTLFESTEDEDMICVNKEMVKHKFAISFGLYRFDTNDLKEQVITKKNPLEEPKPKSKPKSEIRILQKEESPREIKEEDLEAKNKGPLRLEAKVLHYQSPSLFYISLVTQQKTFSELFDNIQKYYSKKQNTGKSDWKVGDKCCTICNQSQTWRRAVILEIENDNAKVFYSDFACVETVPLSSLRELIQEFNVGDAAIKCHLYGVVPAGGDQWSSLSKEFLQELIGAYTRIFITKVGTMKGVSLPVEIWVYHTIPGGALEPNTSEWRCLNTRIIDQGLGIPDRSEQAAEETNETDDNILSFLNITGSVHDWLQLDQIPTKLQLPKTPEKEVESRPTSTPVAEIEEVAGPSNAISDWLPPEPLLNKEFTGIPTFIDNDGVIYLHDVAQQETLALIRNALDVKFKQPDPKAKYQRWNVGEPCVARFFIDDKFYRGRVVSVNDETKMCIVHYIDYGNDEECSFENMRKTIALYQIPVQAHKCFLNRIRPADSTWDKVALDYMHKSIVEKQCFIKITGEVIGDVIPIDLKYDKLWFNDHLVEFDFATYTDGSKPIVPKYKPIVKKMEQFVEVTSVTSDDPDYIIEEDSSNTSSSTSTSINQDVFTDWTKIVEEEEQGSKKSLKKFPEYTEKEFLSNIVVINDINVLELNVIHKYEEVEKYDQMFYEINQEAYNMPSLDGVFQHKACISIFKEDNQWYRASILEYNETQNRLKVRYVDYGNIDIVHLEEVREISEEWIKFPPLSVTAMLYGVRLNPNVEKDIIVKHYDEKFLDKGPFYTTVKDSANSVLLVELKDKKGNLIYDDLIAAGIFLKNEAIND